ncbi:protein takeout-like [Bombus impatiens]|uniref:Protein takeout-like n=1 Tax=Bombus impatiens TaxID=132113 RepID=A0A6P3DPG4_BOMIM|nr:protein takeout-like [Bombus impatiens]
MATIKLLIVVMSLTMAIATDLPSNWKVCSRSLPAEQLTKCLDTAVTDVVTSLGGGLKSLRILPIEPLSVDSVNIGGTQGSVTLKQEYKNIKLYGLTKGIKLYNHHLDVDNGCLLTSDSINPQVDFVADYKIEGKVLLLPVKGSGRSNITMYDLKSHNEISCEKYEKNGETYLKIKKYGVKFSPARINLQFDNLFNGDKILGPQLNNFINENSELLFKELQGPYEETFSQVFTQLSNEVFSRVPLNKIFPPE